MEAVLEERKTGGKKTTWKTVTMIQIQDDKDRTESGDSENAEMADFTVIF